MTSKAHGKLFVLVWSDDGVIKPVVLDTGALPVTESSPLTELDVTLKASDITLPVSEQSPLTSLYSKLWGYWGGAWRNQPIMFGFTSRLAASTTAVSTGDTDTYVLSGGVSAGEIWIVQTISLRHNDVANRTIEIQHFTGTVAVIGALGTDYPAWKPLIWNGGAVYYLGDKIRGHGVSIANGKTLYLDIWGYKMAIS